MDQASILQKVRRHEPLMRYRQGELFFPMKVDNYVAECSLHEWVGGNDHVMRVAPGELNVSNLSQWLSNVNFMVYADQKTYVDVLPTMSAQLTSFSIIPETIEGLRKISAVVTGGKLPKIITETAHAKYGGLTENPPNYYYRVITKEESGEKYDVIQYWFFYAFNDWATTFGGVNDHEGDWEMIQLIFNNIEDEYPLYSVYAAHDGFFKRQWEFTEKDDSGNHPIAYIQGGSHAAFPARNLGTLSYLFKSIAQNPFGLIKYLSEFVEAGGQIWAEGDIMIGQGGNHSWAEPVNLHGEAWVPTYRGLWGTRYYVSKIGSRRKVPKSGGAPSGPMFDTEGFVRSNWETPNNWCEL